ncbi:hypothetical protein HK407_05g09190 [Ordospora pajunii]|uniref:uncharacterized protein n=1 Tax=Ordospora pajunii TaxID=3039483 RepID=UPI0029528895|nr:uncharacterized protein HK407_05g09190 [Ordospora pajunii]KAH9411401.1 hypothetical protein HK407_05g09190 [Ordospora pajunii]
MELVNEYFGEMDAEVFAAVISRTMIDDKSCIYDAQSKCNGLCSHVCEDTSSSAFSDDICHIEMLYRQQVAINNKRKALLEKKLKDRLKYFGYWEILRSIDEEIEGLATKKKRNRSIEEQIVEALGRRQQFLSLFASIGALENDFEGYEALFDSTEDVDCRKYGIERIEYFGGGQAA